MAKTAVKDVRVEIAEYLDEKGTKHSKIAEILDISATHVHFILKAERDLLDEHLKKINDFLGTEFKK